MSVRAKFRCHSVTSIDPGSTAMARFIDESQVPSHQTDVRLDAVWGDGTDNAAWSKATPSGSISMSITVPEAAAVFVPGGEYWVDFTPVDTPAVHVGDVIDPVPEAGHEGPQYVTAVTEHPDGTALDLRPATPEEIAAAGPSTLTTHDGTTITA